ncbi:hypothetical protein CesoFtcFv8_013804 [Champsocephalus esox]|uniref:Uncharacterized protein n=1 Tax=Champsocephalus esox TaxID=159716 RepID=A0AAN8GSD6_9TELE|nr:hypothetical protein CesoFtcFv8_013804 [Champsocephalus esox]
MLLRQIYYSRLPNRPLAGERGLDLRTQSWEEVEVQPERSDAITRGDSRMRHRKELVSKHLAAHGFHDSLNLRMKKIRSSDLQGSKCALGASATVASLIIFKWGFLKEEEPQADLATQTRQEEGRR